MICFLFFCYFSALNFKNYQLASVIFLLFFFFFQISEYMSGDVHILLDLHIPIQESDSCVLAKYFVTDCLKTLE